MKRYSLHYTVSKKDPFIQPEYPLGQYDRLWGYANSIKTLKGKITRIIQANHDAHDFRIYDHAFDDFEKTAFEHCICKRKTVADAWA